MPLDSRGYEVLDDTPVSRPVRFSPPPTLQEQIKRFVRVELSRQAEEQGEETFEDADDFDVGDDYDPKSPWELSADQEAYVEERPAPSPPPAATGNPVAEPPVSGGIPPEKP